MEILLQIIKNLTIIFYQTVLFVHVQYNVNILIIANNLFNKL